MTRKRQDTGPEAAAGPPTAAPAGPDTTTEPPGPLESASGPGGAVGQTEVDEAVVTAFEVELTEALRRAGEAERRADENWDLLLRAEAELENQRKRAERLREDAVGRARRELLARFLNVSDNLERALAHSDADAAQVLSGVEATYRELGRLLTREGVQVVAALDAPFDPALHEAVGLVPVPGLDGERVISVELPGYTLNGELLRPARVIVGRPA